MLLLSCCRHHRALRSFPTRRSSDLVITFATEVSEVRLDRVVASFRWNKATDIDCASSGRWRKCRVVRADRKSTRLNSSHVRISYAVFCLKKKNKCNMTISQTEDFVC